MVRKVGPFFLGRGLEIRHRRGRRSSPYFRDGPDNTPNLLDYTRYGYGPSYLHSRVDYDP